MSHAILDEEYARPVQHPRRKPKAGVAKNREQQLFSALLDTYQSLYASSRFGQNLSRALTSAIKNAPVLITKILSLGLGSLSDMKKGQTRRLKQLAILLAIRSELQRSSNSEIEIYAQDPVFTRQDEILLSSLNIQILRTSSGSSLGEARSMLGLSTLIYSPFLTLEAYEALFSVEPTMQLQMFVSDDFNALKEKWPKYSNERAQVERLLKGSIGRYRRRAVGEAGFWEVEDGNFPMAVYAVERVRERARM